MTLAADGPLLTALSRAKAMLAATAVWSEISSAAKIHFDALPPATPGPDWTKDALIAQRPLAILWVDSSSGFRLQTIAAGCASATGRIVMQIEINTPIAHANDPSALAQYIQRIAGRLVQTGDAANPGLFELSNQPGFLYLKAVEIDSYVRTDRKEASDVGDACLFDLTLHWGR